MKKIEILKLMEANLRVDKTYSFLPCSERMVPELWFDDLTHARIVTKVEGVTEELNLLREATKIIAQKTKEAKELIASANCNHEIRITEYGCLNIATHKCILCGKSFQSNPYYYWDPSELENTYCINYEGKYQSDDEGKYVIKDGHTKEELYSIINDILKDKKDDEEIDLVKEFKKLKLKKAEYFDIKPIEETFIMILGGTNKKYIGNGAYITKPKVDVVKDIYSYFAGQEDTKLLVIDNEDVINSIDHFRNMKKVSYSSIGELENILKEHNQDYKLIIDITDLYDYKVSDNKITQEKYELELQKRYPNSKVIRVNDFNNITKDEVKNKKYILKLVDDQNNKSLNY
jgi:hypothetical protein